MQITVLDGYTLDPGDNPWTEVAALGELTVYDRTPGAQIVTRAESADILLTNKTPITAETILAVPKLRFISVLATGYNVVDCAAAKERGIPVSNVPEYSTNGVAQYVFALLLAHCHRIEHHDRLIRQGEWKKRGEFSFWDVPLQEVAGKTIGIVGFGRIGRRVAELAHAFGMKILAHKLTPPVTPEKFPVEWCGIADLFARADVVTLHCPQTPQNKGMVDHTLLSRMKPSALLINTARGGLISEQDLAEALRKGTIAGAALDVLSEEPIRDDNPLRDTPNCLLTPHIAWATLEARQRLMAVTAQNIVAFLAGHPIHVVNGL